MGFVVTIFSIICAVIAWLRSRDRAGGSPSWRRRVRAMGWGLLLLPIAWIALWLFGVNPATVGLLLLSCAILIMAPGIAADLAAVLLILLGLYGLAAAVAVFKQARVVAWTANAVPAHRVMCRSCWRRSCSSPSACGSSRAPWACTTCWSAG